MRDYKDRHWDNKFEQFMIEKRARKAESSKVETSAPVTPKRNLDLNRTGYNSYRNKIKPTKEERIFVNKGPSRFLKTHAINSQETTSTQTHSNTPQVQIYDDSKDNSSQNQVLENNVSSLKSKFSLMDIMPYVFIVLGLVLVILVITGKI